MVNWLVKAKCHPILQNKMDDEYLNIGINIELCNSQLENYLKNHNYDKTPINNVLKPLQRIIFDESGGVSMECKLNDAPYYSLIYGTIMGNGVKQFLDNVFGESVYLGETVRTLEGVVGNNVVSDFQINKAIVYLSELSEDCTQMNSN